MDGETLQQLLLLAQLLQDGSPELTAFIGGVKSKKKLSASTSTDTGTGQVKTSGKGRWKSGSSKPTTVTQSAKPGGWVVVKSKKARTEQSSEQRSGDVPVSDGVSVPVKASFAEMSSSDSGICLCTMAEAKRALDMMWSDKPAAVLAPMNIEG